MKYIIASLLLCLSACTTVPIVAKFPNAPESAKSSCPQLETVGDDVKLSGVTSTVAKNYSTYYECSVKVDTWIEWYETQKTIFEKVSK